MPIRSLSPCPSRRLAAALRFPQNDPLRYFMMRELPFGSDGDFSHRAMVARLNGDLANDYGNLAQRVLAMINRNCDGAVPQP